MERKVLVNFRLPPDLVSRIKEKAKQNGRTVTAEVTQALTSSYPEDWLSKLNRDLAEKRRLMGM